MAPALCGNLVKTKRTFLALGWTILNILTFVSFLIALLFALTSNFNDKNDNYYNYQNNNEEEQEEEGEMEKSVTSRAMAFTFLWVAFLSSLMGIYGTVVLGFVSPAFCFGQTKYYWCCRNSVHKTTPMVLGAFIGGLLLFANLTLVLSVLFGEFKISDYNDRDEPEEEMRNSTLSNSSTAFSMLCMFLTILYAGFAALVFTYSGNVIEENEEDLRLEGLKPSDDESNAEGYIGSKFTIDTQRTASGSQIMGKKGYIQHSDSSSLA